MMKATASGRFDVKLAPEPLSEAAADSGLGRLSLDKRFHGDLDAVSQGEMLSFRSAEPGSAGYVAMERVQGSLHGRKGGFVLQHSATMTRGEAEQTIMVTPDSGTGELSGISGRLRITITAGEHFYDFDYTLP
ncbi:DUF3224 domain-containing protein [Chromobacterium alkanivorans]|uniref:DUF3224 domain-containing protein n=1 Tax=Chromobacterium alkanivorans TaxID=1071719 RepID=UPI001966F9BF|nr:DUF3224 domain-containing protein [Chromobacterium alkanivorans]MBN3005116.1 DUF3224 domain-containing protein [Chromobacterium alkanivorans]